MEYQVYQGIANLTPVFHWHLVWAKHTVSCTKFNSSLEHYCTIMLAQLKIVVLFKETIKQAFFGLLENLELLWAQWCSRNDQKERAFLRNSSVYCRFKKWRLFYVRDDWRDLTMMWITALTEQHKLALTTESKVGGPSSQLCRRIKTSDASQVLS